MSKSAGGPQPVEQVKIGVGLLRFLFIRHPKMLITLSYFVHRSCRVREAELLFQAFDQGSGGERNEVRFEINADPLFHTSDYRV